MFSRRLVQRLTTTTLTNGGQAQRVQAAQHKCIYLGHNIMRISDSGQNRWLSTTPRMALAAATAAPGSAPIVMRRGGVGGVKGALYGFLAGCTLAGAVSYYYFLEEYKVANELLTEDVDALRASVLRIEQYVRSVEDKLADGSVAVKKK